MAEQTTISAAPTASTPALPKISLDRLGSYYDGWTDLIENRGGKADQLRAEVVSILRQRYPEKPVEVVNGTIFVHKAPRPYLLTRTSPGATTTIYIADRGQDLHVSWRAFRGRVLNIVAKIVLIVAVLLTLILLQQLGNFFLAIAAFIIITGGLLWLLSQYSEMVKGDPQAIFYKEASLFDQEDMVATNLSVHKSLLQALDKVGIDPKELRLKQNYNAGAGDGQI